MKRVATGIVVGLLWLLVLYLGSAEILVVVLGGVTCVALKEYFTITLTANERPFTPALCLLGVLPVAAAYMGGYMLLIASIFASFILLLTCVILSYSKIQAPFDLILKGVLALFYIGLSAAHLLMITTLDNGWFWLFLLSALICASDSGAYYIGSSIGRHKLCPSVSPGKSVEGFFGGIMSAAVVAFILVKLMDVGVDPFKAAILALITAALGVVGDLSESILKRAYNIKDSGSILPGHGGVLDRVDSLLLTGPFLFYALNFFSFN